MATPTGSTAYNLSARGPIVAPTHRAMLLTPVSPHMLFDRSLVLEPTTRLRLTVVGPPPGHAVGRRSSVEDLAVGDADRVHGLDATGPGWSSFGPRDFHQILKAKFRLSDR